MRILKKIFFIILLSGCANSLYTTSPEKSYPVFTIGTWNSSNSYIFKDSIVYLRGFSDYTGSSRETPSYYWLKTNDSTILFNKIHKKQRTLHPDGFIFRIYGKYPECQLLIPLDSIPKFKQNLKSYFNETIDNFEFQPSAEEQEYIDMDSSYLYPKIQEEYFSKTIMLVKPRLAELGIWSGSGF